MPYDIEVKYDPNPMSWQSKLKQLMDDNRDDYGNIQTLYRNGLNPDSQNRQNPVAVYTNKFVYFVMASQDAAVVYSVPRWNDGEFSSGIKSRDCYFKWDT